MKENAEQSNRELKEMMEQLQECLKIKRRKNAIADKLVELELIADQSEILASKKSKKNKANFLESNLTEEFVVSDKSSDEEGEPKKSIFKKKKKAKKTKKSKQSDLFDAESGSSDSSIDDSDSSGSDSDGNSKKKPFRLSLSDNDEDTPKVTRASSDESSADERLKKTSKQTLKLLESDESENSDAQTKKKRNKKPLTKKRSDKLMTNDNVLKLILSESENEKVDSDADLISGTKS